MISMQLLLRVMIPMGSSSGTPGGQTGATMAAATCPSMIGIVVEAWVGVSRRVSDFCQPGPQGGPSHRSIYGNARRPSVAGSAVPLTKVPAVETVRPWYIRLLKCVKGDRIKPK